ncbi:MAG: hypothetical protein JOZ43_05555 [Acidobacteriales bacterium]|nr:hypothetical protein [Terriglobales bacterium]
MTPSAVPAPLERLTPEPLLRPQLGHLLFYCIFELIDSEARRGWLGGYSMNVWRNAAALVIRSKIKYALSAVWQNRLLAPLTGISKHVKALSLSCSQNFEGLCEPIALSRRTRLF